MPTLVTRPKKDPIKRYGLAVLGIVSILGGLAAVITARRSSSSSPDDLQTAVNEQSLNFINSNAPDAFRSDQVQGIPLTVDPLNPSNNTETSGAKNTGASKPVRNLETHPTSGISAPGAPIVGRDSAGLKNSGSGSSLAQALKQVALDGKKANKGWGGDAPRTGFNVPHANFGGLSGLGSGGGGSSGASASGGGIFQGGGGRGGGSAGPGGALGSSALSGTALAIKEGRNQTLNSLKQAEALGTQALLAARTDQSSGLAGRSFDASASKPGLSLNGPGGGEEGITGDGVPENLKANDPALSSKKIEVPKVASASNVKSQAELQQQTTQQIESILIQTAIGGILGPLFSGVGSTMAAGIFGYRPRAG